jgi:hypothetical protein
MKNTANAEAMRRKNLFILNCCGGSLMARLKKETKLPFNYRPLILN